MSEQTLECKRKLSILIAVCNMIVMTIRKV